MTNIEIKNKKKTPSGWELKVLLESDSFIVFVDEDYWELLTGGVEEVENLVKRSFEFLLEREPKESILKQFNLRDIESYFPEYRRTI